MSRVGRNAPCPCGSGKKYKKCCLWKDAANGGSAGAARRRTRSRPGEAAPVAQAAVAYDPAREAERGQRLSRLVTRIWHSSTAAYDQWISRRDIRVVNEVARHFATDPSTCGQTAFDYLCALAFFGRPGYGKAHREFREVVRTALKRPTERRLLALFEATPLQVWCAHPDSKGRVCEGHPIAGPDSRRARLLNAVSSFGRSCPPGVYAGWPLPFDGGRYLLFAVPLGPDAVAAVQSAADRLHKTDFHRFWECLEHDVVHAVLDLLIERAAGTALKSERRVDKQVLRWEVLWRLGQLARPPLRIQLAGARTAADLAPVLARVGEVRDRFLRPLATALGDDFDDLVPLESLLEHYGVALDGSMSAERIEAARRMPVAVVGLAPQVLARAGLDSLLPTAKALAWANASPGHPSEGPVRAACERYLTEQRWLATFDATRRQRAGTPADYYDELMEGFKHLFEPGFFDVSLGDFGLSRGSLSRLQNGARLAPSPRSFDTLGDLPMCMAQLSALKNVGLKTIDDIAQAAFEHARTWRRGRIALDDARLDALLQSAGQPDADLRDGLDELASLFGGGAELPASTPAR